MISTTGRWQPLTESRRLSRLGYCGLDHASLERHFGVVSTVQYQVGMAESRHEAEAPSPFEVFCDLNSSDINCHGYND
jgi:hypothetical protein